MSNKLTQNTNDDKGNFLSCDNHLVGVDGTIFDSEYLTRLTKSLALITFLPSDDDWVCILGNGDETNNGEALRSWVTHQSDELIDHKASHHIEILLSKFQDLMSDFYAHDFL